jgi:hypothetical protein
MFVLNSKSVYSGWNPAERGTTLDKVGHLLPISKDLLKGTKAIEQKPNVKRTDVQSFQTWVKLNSQGA